MKDEHPVTQCQGVKKERCTERRKQAEAMRKRGCEHPEAAVETDLHLWIPEKRADQHSKAEHCELRLSADTRALVISMSTGVG